MCKSHNSNTLYELMEFTMNIHHLKYFYDSARLGSISKAAEVNLVGQPAISKAIKGLEQELGTKLINHKRNQFLLTDEGTNAYRYSLDVFKAIEKFRDSIQQENDFIGEVRFACQSSMAESPFLSNAIKAITDKYPAIVPHLSLGRTDLVRSWLADGIIDFAIVINNTDFRNFNKQKIAEGNFNLIKSKSYQGKWKQDGILMTEQKKELLQLQQKFSTLNNFALKSKMKIGSWGVIKNFSLQGVGVGFVPDYLIKKEIANAELSYVEKNKYSIPYEVILITPKNKYLSTLVTAVIKQFIPH